MSHRRSPGIAVLGAVLIGALTALQARVNGSLGGELGDGVLAGGISFGSGLVVVLIIAAALPAGRA
ncbi:DMT family transporter, partial [Streptomyces scabiei]